MRGKNAKALRRFAEQQTVGAPEVKYTAKKFTKFYDLPDGRKLPFEVVTLSLGTCTRKAYKALKREFKRLRAKGLYVGREVNTARA